MLQVGSTGMGMAASLNDFICVNFLWISWGSVDLLVQLLSIKSLLGGPIGPIGPHILEFFHIHFFAKILRGFVCNS